jgi:aryl-alcohol dehydrogenase-like predicted oxidoreductase
MFFGRGPKGPLPRNTASSIVSFMEYVNLGPTGLRVSRLCLGTMSYGSTSWRKWVLEEEASRPFIRRALELGINFFDTADMYSMGQSEGVLGRALRDFIKREQVVIATKVFFPMSEDPNDRGLSRKHITHAIDASLKRLETDYIDLYQMHRWDPQTPIEETLIALHDLVKAGKVLHIGASTMSAWQFAKLMYTADQLGVTRPVSMQPYYNILYREEEREMIPLCRAEGIAVIPYSPIARGFVTGERPKETFGDTVRAKTDDYMKKLYYKQEDYTVVDRITQVARSRGIPNVQIALAWVLHQPGITSPIIGATKLNQLEQLVSTIDVKLDAAELQSLSEVYQPLAPISDMPRPK